MRPGRLLQGLVVMCTGAILSGACTWDWGPYDKPGPLGPAGVWQLTFQEECAAPLDPTRWTTTFVAPDRRTTFRRFDWSNEWVVEENVKVSDGNCQIVGENRPSGDAPFTSGTMTTVNKFEQKGGYFEVRAKLPRGMGVGSQISLPGPDSWPPEVNFGGVQGWTPDQNTVGAYYKDATARTALDDRTVPTVDLTRDFHTFGVQWEPDRLIYFLDGTAIANLTDAAPTMTQALPLRMTVHLGNQCCAQPDATTPWPAVMAIDWIRVYKRAP